MEPLLSSVGQLPAPSEHVPIVKAKPRRVRVLRAAFFHEGRIPVVGDHLTLPSGEAAGLVARGLAEFA